MTNIELIHKVLDDIQPQKMCDDCLSDDLQIRPRQQVNQICRQLKDQDKIIREKDVCDSCRKQKITNVISVKYLQSSPEKKDRESSTSHNASHNNRSGVEIETLRTQIVRICRQIWSDHKNEPPSPSISIIINSLKSDNVIPFHQANMMLTLCNLRNVYVYEELKLGKRESAIASNAWSIVSDWWGQYSKEQIASTSQ